MKNLATILAVFIVSVSFSQTENLVQYQLDATTKVYSIRVTEHSYDKKEKCSVRRIESISENTINLKLNESRDYTVLINNEIVVEIKKEDITEYVAQQNCAFHFVENSNAPRNE